MLTMDVLHRFSIGLLAGLLALYCHNFEHIILLSIIFYYSEIRLLTSKIISAICVGEEKEYLMSNTDRTYPATWSSV